MRAKSPRIGRRDVVAGLAAVAAAGATAGLAGCSDEPIPAPRRPQVAAAPADSATRYRPTPHVERFYELARF